MKKKTRNILLVVIVLSIIGIGVGYASLAQNLILDAKVSSKSSTDWNIKIQEISKTDQSGEATNLIYNVNTDMVSASFSATLIPDAFVTYTVTTVNKGTIAAKVGTPIISYASNGDSEFIDCVVTPNLENVDILNNNETHKFDITLRYTKDSLPLIAESEKVTIVFPYSQAE